MVFTCTGNFSYLVAWTRDNKISKTCISSTSYVCLKKMSFNIAINTFYVNKNHHCLHNIMLVPTFLLDYPHVGYHPYMDSLSAENETNLYENRKK